MYTTWKDDDYNDVGQMHLDLKFELDKLHESIGEKYILLVRINMLKNMTCFMKRFCSIGDGNAPKRIDGELRK